MTPCIAVDHFAGTGWGVACQRIGIREFGAEKMPAAIRTRSANGMRTIYRDVWSGLFHPWLVPPHRMYIASPPCTTFSLAGTGEGRRSLDDVMQAIDDRRFTDPMRLVELGEMLDPRTALVLTPLAHIWAHRPELVALEQVPPVLPVWQAVGRVLRSMGYSVWAGILRSEMFGVPQTRRRAILMARSDGKVAPPIPTHSRYYSSEPGRIDPGVRRWVSMAEALGWGMTAAPSYTITSGGAETGGYEPFPKGARDGMAAAAAAGEWSELTVETGQNSRTTTGAVRYEKSVTVPAPTVTGQVKSWVYRSGSRTRAAVRDLDAPAPTVLFGKSANEVVWMNRPATTIGADDRVAGPGRSEFVKGGTSRQDRPGTVRVTVDEAAALQSYPPGFEWRGSKSKRFLQIGNAVPPLLATAILSALMAPAEQRDEWESVFAEVAG